ncbi:transposase [Saccharopolyspora pogona]|uniref:transposase n=1 Tax=Saccharopolyspora pogona TaxID=333966 RepID=UPI001CC22AAF|nr:transposase [Saccharopolyspora pogona]
MTSCHRSWLIRSAGLPEIRRCLDELEAEEAAAAAAAAEKNTQARLHLQRVAIEPVPGRLPAGVDRVEAARARLERERARRQGEIDAYNAAVAAALAEGRPRPLGRRVSDPEGGKRMKKARAALEAALAAAEATSENNRTTTSNNGSNNGGKKEDTPPQRNVTDPDSRIMPTRRGWIQGFNAQFAVSADHVITTLGLSDNPADTGEFADMLTRTQATAEWLNTHRDTPEDIGTALFDAGYFSDDNLTHPGPDRLIAPGKSRHIQREAATNPASGPPPEGATPVEAMRHRLRTPEAATLYKKRGATVEPVNGLIKDRHRLRRFSLRGLAACLGELNLTAATHNLRRLFTTLHTTTT